MRIYFDERFRFYELFNEKTGFFLRTNVIDENNHFTDEEPRFRSFPELIDIGIVGSCHTGGIICKSFGVDCYQGNANAKDMDFAKFKRIIDEIEGKSFQIALGGKGDPNKHKDFTKFVRYASKHNVVPNLTTSGYLINDKEIKAIKKYCGAVAVSFYSKLVNGIESNPQTIEAIKRLLEYRVTTNIHYVVSTKTIDDLILRLETDSFPKGINALILLLYKPVGYGSKSYVITNDEKIKRLFDLLKKQRGFQIGFDSCFVPLCINYFESESKISLQTCEAARFSCYIAPDFKMYPCSFGQFEGYSVDLNYSTIRQAWGSNKIRSFLYKKPERCTECNKDCIAGCPLNLNQNIC